MANPFTPEQISQILEEFFKVVGTRQYIGARYVPIFGRKGEESIEWNNSAPYEPLTIVLYQGYSYTSRQYVPAGVEITNQEFWALTGNYNAQIEAYRKEVRAILPYDETPTDGSAKAVTSDGIKKAIAVETARATEAEQTNAAAINTEKTRADEAERTLKSSIDTIAPFDVTPTEGSVKGVTSGGIYSAINNAVPANASVTSEKLANGSVTSEKLANGSVTSEKLANASVTSENLANASVKSENLANASVTSEKLANASVTAEKLANASVTSEKLSSDALTSLIHGMSIRRFGNAGGTANDGLVLPSGNTIKVVLDGLYVPELTLLIICDVEILNSSTNTPYQSTFTLPSYIPRINVTGRSVIIGACVEYSPSNSFANWHNIRLLQDGSNLKLVINTNDMTNSCASMGACAVLLRAYGAE